MVGGSELGNSRASSRRGTDVKAVASDLDVEIRNGAAAPGSARRAVGKLSDRIPQTRLEGLQLLVSELVTNSVRHAGMGPDGRIRVRVRVARNRIRLEVTDGGPGFVPPKLEPSVYSESGWGLFLVDQLSDRWGVRSRPTTCVWLELDPRPA
jgi:anti-sigma regulatory factor (Ser/Thr protein kinase)